MNDVDKLLKRQRRGMRPHWVALAIILLVSVTPVFLFDCNFSLIGLFLLIPWASDTLKTMANHQQEQKELAKRL